MRKRAWLLAVGIVLAAACSPVEGPGPDGGSPPANPDAGSTQPPPCEGLDYARCEGICTSLQNDARHCGACGNACPEGGVCTDGVCRCLPEQALCEDDAGPLCTDLRVDADHCGSCGNRCAVGTVCAAGACVETCPAGQSRCGERCADLQTDPGNCGACGVACEGNAVCGDGVCRCAEGSQVCGGVCADLRSDPNHCGGCGTQCFAGFLCTDGRCVCPPGLLACTTACVDVTHDPNNCGGCNLYCAAGQACVNGICETPCPPGHLRCGAQCVDPMRDPAHCGACGAGCGGLSCIGGQCTSCDPLTTDCDGDGWKVADGDCCDVPGSCGAQPARVNPGALELLGNGIDDNCNGLLDAADAPDVADCDSKLPSNSSDPLDYARALGLCRTTTETAPLSSRTWGVISAELLRVDGSPLTTQLAASIRPQFGAALGPRQGDSLVVLSSGIASDATQTQPGPNGLPTGGWGQHVGGTIDLSSCALPGCVGDWFALPNPPLKLANRLPEAPGCTGGGFGAEFAYDSVMLALRLRAPTNARAFQFSGYFISAEYPEFVCTTFNDQLVALVDTPAGPPQWGVNPPDKNLMTWFGGGQRWPIGINVARGTSLFKVCETQAQRPACWDPDVSPQSCTLGASELAGTGYDHENIGPGCLNGGGTGWLVTSGNVNPGEIVELRIALWDVGDQSYDSLALLDGFRWLEQPTQAGTTD